MGLLGIFSLIQIGLIPGLLITAPIKTLSRYDRALLVLPMSCIINYFLVVTLVFLGSYNQPTVLAIFLAEITALLLYSKNGFLKEKYAFDISVLNGSGNNISTIVRLLVISILIFYSVLTIKELGTVFTDSDVVVSWNKWAIDWYNGISPRNTFHYPQLIPTLYSLTYQFIGNTEVELFAKQVPALFPLMMLLTFLRISSIHKNNGTKYLLALVLFWFAFSRMMGSSSAFNGYADLPLGYFVLLAIYIFDLAHETPSSGQANSNFMYLLLCSIVIAGGAITKHSALYLATILPIAWYLHFRKETSIRQIMIAYMVILLVAGHWFIYKQIQIYSGADNSNLQYLSELVALPWYAKLWHGITMISSKISWLWIPLLFAGVLTPMGRAHAVWIFIPYFVLWALFASYDYRNLILALPSLGYIMASGMVTIHQYFNESEKRSKVYRGASIMVGFALIAVILVMLSTPKIGTDLEVLQTIAKRATGEPKFNEQLYAFFEFHPEPAMIASTYYALSHLPVLKERDLPASCNELEQLANNNAVKFVIVGSHCSEVVSAKIASKYKKWFEGKDVIFYEVYPNNLVNNSL